MTKYFYLLISAGPQKVFPFSFLCPPLDVALETTQETMLSLKTHSWKIRKSFRKHTCDKE